MPFLSLENTNDNSFRTVPFSFPKLKVVHNYMEKHADQYRTNFELLYDNYAPKVYGFITKHTDTKQQAEEAMTNVFLKVWQDIKTFDKDADKKIQQIVLMTCKPLYKEK